MTWVSTATDGYAVGSLSFLSNYEIGENYQTSEATIERTDHDTEWDRYNFRDGSSSATIHVRKSLRSSVDNILEVPHGSKLEGKVVNAYYKHKVLVGFTPKK
jgi:hypothetical protein